ncbi:glycosyltransferase [Janthinobacterium agaricidamnosum]|uniref:PGL/p-HBAD biosynthesis rhamnosyltransferase n=1 Tax=Janthinobacterium agaricidamnosum NBRC 102515 = DSM 9628 TaxID=1349767 RepID=W0V7J7_9BURK|nr:glycosyltransferase [Janthinobacterium agaricidamnosum]CDG83851.1 PGL/p-HBAD biosynthesis rhamnosyltransferase [Janthinobacterium agaricidamnosum NBRC 102515 = DSM 9628]
MMARKKILFLAEAVTLAHVGRPLALAALLDAQRFAIEFACSPGCDAWFRDSGWVRHDVHSISSAQFLKALADGKPVYDAATLAAYVEDDLRLLDTLRPDIVIGDFRLSLSVSARLAKVPYVALINAYWSPYVRQHYSVPSLPLSALLPIPLANALFKLARPLAFAAHTLPLNQVRRRYGLAPLGPDLRRIYTDADRTLYADVPELFPPQAMPASHSYLGPVTWSPPWAEPGWWHQLPSDKPLVYVTLGSSGQGQLLPLVLRALASLPVSVMAATANTVELGDVPPNAHVAPFLPGETAARRANLVICNGGSPTSQQALSAGVPVIGICGNLDQFLNMHGIAAAGAGTLLRADRFSETALRNATQRMLNDAASKQAAQRIAGWFASYPAGPRLSKALDQLLR